MNFEELARIESVIEDENSFISVKFDRIVNEFTERDHFCILYSKIEYRCKNFIFKSTVPTVRIPYKDPSIGFLIDGSISSSIGVYQRAPGVLRAKNNDGSYHVDIVSARNTVVTLMYRRGGIIINFKRNGKNASVPIGVFLKAISGLPYKLLLQQFAFKSVELLASFPTEIPKPGATLSRSKAYGAGGTLDEPTHDECVEAVYNAIYHIAPSNQDVTTDLSGRSVRQYNYSTQWKVGRIKAYFNGLHFKNSRLKSMELGNRAVGSYIARQVSIRVFDEEGSPDVKLYSAGVYVDAQVGLELNKYDLDTIYVSVDHKPFAIQSSGGMWFKAKGYKTTKEYKELGIAQGCVIGDEELKKFNDSELCSINVRTPDGVKIIRRSGEEPELSDFVNIINCLMTASFQKIDDTEAYNVSNRIIIDYDRQVRTEVETVYDSIIESLGSGLNKDNALQFPRLPSDALQALVRNRENKEICQSDMTNVMSRAISEGKASALMLSTPASMQAVQPDQYGRLDSLHAPESDKIGAIQQMTVMAQLREDTGEITTPLEVIENGIPTGRIEQVTASKEANRYVAAWDDDLSETNIKVRFNGDVTTVEKTHVNYRDVSPFQDMSISRATVPFAEFSMPRRSLMATKMSGQAVPLIFPQRPRVSTGGDTEVPCLYYTVHDILEFSNIAEIPGELLHVLSVAWSSMTADYTMVYGKTRFNFSVPFVATDKETLYCFRINYKDNDLYGLDDIVFYNQSCDIKEHEYWTRIKQGAVPFIKDIAKPSLALGTNLRVCYKTAGSSTIDDAVMISSRLVTDMTLSSIQIFKYDYDLKGEEDYHSIIIPSLHHFVETGHPVISLIREGKTNRQVKAKQAGDVIKATVTKEGASVWVATYHDAEIGDKVAGRYGNKSVIARICPEGQMPYDPDTGESMDICCSPLGIPSRMNLGQLLEVALGGIMLRRDKYAVVTPFYKGIKSDIEAELKLEDIKPKRLFLPAYGKLSERPITTGVMYFLKLEQIANLKIAAIGYPKAVDPVFGQPSSSASGSKGQAMGEMETWAFIAAGANKTLNSICTLYSESETSRKKYFEMLHANVDTIGAKWDESENGLDTYHVNNRGAMVVQTVYRMFGLDVETRPEDPERFFFRPLDLDDITVSTSVTNLKNHNELVNEGEWTKIPMKTPVINPFWIQTFPLGKLLGVQGIKSLADGKLLYSVYTHEVINPKDIGNRNPSEFITGLKAIIDLVQRTSLEKCYANLKASAGITDVEDAQDASLSTQVFTARVLSGDDNDSDVQVDLYESPSAELAGLTNFLNTLKKSGKELDTIIWNEFPVMPRIFRQSTLSRGKKAITHPFQSQIESLCTATTAQDAYDILRQFIGYGKQENRNMTSIRQYFFGKGAGEGDHGKVRGSVLSKHIGFSGRCVIVPAQDIHRYPYFIGVPWRIAMIELAKPLAIRLKYKMKEFETLLLANGVHVIGSSLSTATLQQLENIIESLWEYNPFIIHTNIDIASEDVSIFYDLLRDFVKRMCEGGVREDGAVWYEGSWVFPENLPEGATIEAAHVAAGRQPTLHKKSIRIYFMYLVDGFAMHMHPTVCNAYNADFDGDTMWDMQLFGDSKVEGWKTMSVLQDLISEKDGSYTLKLLQDSALGLYNATTFKDNVKVPSYDHGECYVYSDAESLREDLEYGTLHYYDPVIFVCNSKRRYLSTAGRILVNCALPDGLTTLPYEDKDSICEQVFGKEFISSFCQLQYDMPWAATDLRPADRPHAVKLEDILLRAYKGYGARKSIDVVQKLYQIGVIASDIYSVSMGIEDMSVDVDVDKFMETPRNNANKLNSLYQLGLITDEERKTASATAWESAKSKAKSAVIAALSPQSNMYYSLYSGARGKTDQLMQAVGFIGSISKTATTDIQYPILSSYGAGLSSLDLAQTCYSARIGVVSTQDGTKLTGYATRQSVYMNSGLCVTSDCGISIPTETVRYDSNHITLVLDGCVLPNEQQLLGESIDPNSKINDPLMERLHGELGSAGYLLNERILDLILEHDISGFQLLDGKYVSIKRHLDSGWRNDMLDMYSFSLPYTDNMHITEQSLDWVEDMELTEIVAFTKDDADNGNCFRSAYLEVDYNKSMYTCLVDGKEIAIEALYHKPVNANTEGYSYFKRLLGVGNNLTTKALQYLTKKAIKSISFEDGTVVNIRYELTSLFKKLILGRVASGLPYLGADSEITQQTVQAIEDYQLKYIGVYTSLTCLSHTGVCRTCYGKSLTTNGFTEEGTNIAIPADQAMCEPLSQATLNVTHSGGNRTAGTGLVSGLSYYTKLLKGSLVSEKSKAELEVFSPFEGYVHTRQEGDEQLVSVVDENNVVLAEYPMTGCQYCNLPDDAKVDVGDTIISGYVNLNRYSDRDVFHSALKTRYLLIQEYQKVFEKLSVSPRNFEIMARAQTSNCFLAEAVDAPRIKDTAEESEEDTGNYLLRVSTQAQTVQRFSGLASFGFENAPAMLLANLCEGSVANNSWLSNIITGTPIGTTEAKMIPVRYGQATTSHKKSAVAKHEEKIYRRFTPSTILAMNGMNDDAQLLSAHIEHDDPRDVLKKLELEQHETQHVLEKHQQTEDCPFSLEPSGAPIGLPELAHNEESEVRVELPDSNEVEEDIIIPDAGDIEIIDEPKQKKPEINKLSL